MRLSGRRQLLWVVLGNTLLACGGPSVPDSGVPDSGKPDAGTPPDCTKSGVACTYLGQPGKYGFNGNGHNRLETELYWPMDIKFTKDGTPWFIDWNNHMVRKVLTNQTVTTAMGWSDIPVVPAPPGGAVAGLAGDGFAGEATAAGVPGTNVQLNHPTDLAELADGSLLVMAWHNHKLRKLDPQGNSHILAGGPAGFAGDNGPEAAAVFKQPSALEIDDQGNQYIIDQQNWRIRKIDAAGIITTLAGTGVQGFSGDMGPATAAQFSWAAGSNPEPNGGLAHKGDQLFISDTLNNRIRVIDLTTGMVDTLAGTGTAGFSGDGAAASLAMLNHPRDLEVGSDGNLYLADTDNNRVRMIDLSTKVITTVVGTGVLGLDAVEGKPGPQTALKRPFGLGFDLDGNLYVCDTINSRILKVNK